MLLQARLSVGISGRLDVCLGGHWFPKTARRYMRYRLRLLVPVLCLLMAVPFGAEAQETPFGSMDVFDLEWVTDPQISPDGEQIVYVRRGMDIMKDRRTAELWMMDADGSNHVKLTDRSTDETSPRWSPDGTRIAFTAATNDEGTQIFLHYVEHQRTVQHTQLDGSPGNIAWSPDGDYLAFTKHVAEDPPTVVDPPEAPEDAEWADAPRIETRLNHELDGTGTLEYGYSHVFVVPAESGPVQQVTSGEYHHDSQPVWTPDGEHLIFSANRHDNWMHERRNTELYQVPADSGAVEPLTDRFGPNHTPAVSPDGETIAYLGFDDQVQTYQHTQLYTMDRDGENSTAVPLDLERSVSDITWDQEGDGLYLQYANEGDTKLAYATLDGSLTSVAEGLGGTYIGRPYAGSAAYSVSSDGTIVFNQTSPYRPAELARTHHTSGDVEQLTDLNGELVERRALGNVEEVWYRSSDDEYDLHGWVITPPGYDSEQSYPLIVELHGGPISHYGPHFAPELQLFASAGYAVFYPNFRGSTSYGEAFANELQDAFSGAEYQDIIDGVDYLVEEGIAAEDSLYVTGGSAGGTATAWIVGQTDRFQAAAVQKPVMNWISKTLAADNYYAYADYRYPGQAWENPMDYWDVSPISLVGNVETPTMVIVGEKDLRTPTWEARQLYHALKLRDIETLYVEVPDTYHFIADRPSQLITKVDHILAWFERYR